MRSSSPHPHPSPNGTFLFRHILPNVAASVIVLGTLGLGSERALAPRIYQQNFC
jgi:hypothetical protein